MNPKYVLEAESAIFVSVLDVEYEKEEGVENDSQVSGVRSWGGWRWHLLKW